MSHIHTAQYGTTRQGGTQDDSLALLVLLKFVAVLNFGGLWLGMFLSFVLRVWWGFFRFFNAGKALKLDDSKI